MNSLFDRAATEGGSQIDVRVGRIPGSISTLPVRPGASVNDILRQAKITDLAGHEVRVDNLPASLDRPVTQFCTILVVQKIQGNSR